VRIGELAERTGVPQRMLRYYEQQGLLAPRRGDNGYRRYAEQDIARVRQVRGLISSGMPTRIIRLVLQAQETDGSWKPECSREFARALTDELAAVEDRIACLQQGRDTIRAFLERAEAPG
jgi:DNA-binding transcriptional MerR regulator